MKTRVLLVDDEADVRSMLRIVLEANDFDVADVPNVGAVLAAVRDHRPHVVVLDHDLGSAVTGVELAPLIKHQDPSQPGRPHLVVGRRRCRRRRNGYLNQIFW